MNNHEDRTYSANGRRWARVEGGASTRDMWLTAVLTPTTVELGRVDVISKTQTFAAVHIRHCRAVVYCNNELINQSINQSISQSVNQSVNQSIRIFYSGPLQLESGSTRSWPAHWRPKYIHLIFKSITTFTVTELRSQDQLQVDSTRSRSVITVKIWTELTMTLHFIVPTPYKSITDYWLSID